MNEQQQLREQIAAKQLELQRLEDELHSAGIGTGPEAWQPTGFYTAYYLLAGGLLGFVAAWAALACNVVGAAFVGLDDPLRLLRVYSTIIGGERTVESTEAVVLVFAIGLHTATGMVCGAPIHVVLSRFFPPLGPVVRIGIGVALGLAMWIINYYGILSWLQPLIDGSDESYIVKTIPAGVAASTHVVFAVIVTLLQPLARFDPKTYRWTPATAETSDVDPAPESGDPGE